MTNLIQLTDALRRAANIHESDDFSDPLRESINALMDASEDDGADVIETVCRLLNEVESGYGAGMLAIWLGAMVEQGHPPDASAQAVRDSFVYWAGQIETHDDSEPTEGKKGAFLAIEKCAQSLVAHYSRSEDLLTKLREDQVMVGEIERLAADCSGAQWLDQLICQASGDLVVLNVERQEGAIVRYENLSNCFHLFTLLQGAFSHWLPVRKQPTNTILECARGIALEDERDYARWHFGQLEHSLPATESWVWGEAHPSTIKSLHGQQVLLIWPMLLESRGWDAGFFSPQLKCRVPDVKIVRTLSADEYAGWKEKLNLPNLGSRLTHSSTNRPWWRFWQR